MLLVTEDAVIVCGHPHGRVQLAPSQDFCTIAGRRVLVDSDPEGRPISGCANVNPAVGIKACLQTLAVTSGYSEFIRIGGRRVCLGTLSGLTDGTPPGTIHYVVSDPSQSFVGSA